MKKSFVKSASLLMLATLGAKFIGALFRLPLTNLVGVEGMGLYQLVYPVYSLMLTLSSGAIPLAISILVSEKNALGNRKESNSLVKSALRLLLFTGLLLSLSLFFLSGFLSKLQGQENAYLGYLAISPSILFVSGIAVLRGYFQGLHQTFPTSLSQISEAVVKLIVGLSLAYILTPMGVVYQVAGALFGVSISEVATFLILYVLYKKRARLKTSFDFKIASKEYKEILKISLPITIGGIIFPLTQFIDSFMVVNVLKNTLGATIATSSYGLYSGPISTLINLPVSLSLALGIAVVPHLSKNKEERNLGEIRLKTSTAVKTAVMVGTPFTILFLMAPTEILSLLYKTLTENELILGAEMLMISAPTIIFLSITQICTAVLQGLKDLKSPIVNLIIGGVTKTLLSLVLLYTIGIKGVAVAGLISFLVVAVLNLLSVFRLMGKNSDIVKNSGAILLFGAIIGVSLSIGVAFHLSGAMLTIISIFSGIFYLFLVVTSKVFTEEEILSLPFGGKIIKLKKGR